MDKLALYFSPNASEDFQRRQFNAGFYYGRNDRKSGVEYSVVETNFIYALGYSLGLKSELHEDAAWLVAKHMLTAVKE
jgi:hypothetical protein